jgi:integrase
MARKRKLDPYVSVFVDRHGKERFRFRRSGFSCYLPSPSSKEYRDAYNAALGGVGKIQSRATPGTVGDLVPRFYESLAFKRGGLAWQTIVRQILEAFREEYGSDPVKAFRPKDIETILSRKAQKKVVGKKIVGGTAAAKRLREQLDRLFRFAVKLEWIERNPVDLADDVQHNAIGFFPWEEPHIAQFRQFWPIGTKPRLALELVLWTGVRRADARLLPPPKDGRIKGKAGKTGKAFDFIVAPALQEAIDAMPAVGLTTLLVTDYGKPFSAAGFGQWFKDKCILAGLPQCTLHGLRKALARRAADLDVPQQGLKALGQWSGDREVATYVAGANQRRAAESALDAVIQWEREGNIV